MDVPQFLCQHFVSSPPYLHSSSPSFCTSCTFAFFILHLFTPPTTLHSSNPPLIHSSTPSLFQSSTHPLLHPFTLLILHSSTPPPFTLLILQSSTPPLLHPFTLSILHLSTPPPLHSSHNTPPLSLFHSSTPPHFHASPHSFFTPSLFTLNLSACTVRQWSCSSEQHLGSTTGQ